MILANEESILEEHWTNWWTLEGGILVPTKMRVDNRVHTLGCSVESAMEFLNERGSIPWWVGRWKEDRDRIDE